MGKKHQQKYTAQPHGGTGAAQNRAVCAVPTCGKVFVVEAGKPPICKDCQDFAAKLVWFMTHIQVRPTTGPGGLVLPGQQVFGAPAIKLKP